METSVRRVQLCSCGFRLQAEDQHTARPARSPPAEAGSHNCQEALSSLRAGDAVEITGRVLTLRDAAAARLTRALERREALPVSLEGQVLYAAGPSPPKPGQVIGSAGPTTTARMARYLPALFGAGVRAVIGKGELHGDDMEGFVRHGAIYFAAIGGLGALLAKHITAASVAAYAELGPEALYVLDVADFPAAVIIDAGGRNFHELARAQWRRV